MNSLFCWASVKTFIWSPGKTTHLWPCGHRSSSTGSQGRLEKVDPESQSSAVGESPVQPQNKTWKVRRHMMSVCGLYIMHWWRTDYSPVQKDRTQEGNPVMNYKPVFWYRITLFYIYPIYKCSWITLHTEYFVLWEMDLSCLASCLAFCGWLSSTWQTSKWLVTFYRHPA